MSKIIALLLCLAALFSLVGCNNQLSLTASEAAAFVDTSYYDDIVLEKQNNTGINSLIPFRPFNFEKTIKPSAIPLSLFERFPVIKEFNWSDEGSPVYINGQKYKRGKTLTFSVLLNTTNEITSICPTLIFIKHDEKNGVETYNSIRFDPDTLKFPHFEGKDEDAEFGDGYFGYNVSMSLDKNSNLPLANYPLELFSVDFSFPVSGHYTVAVIDGHKNGGKYTDSLSLIIE